MVYDKIKNKWERKEYPQPTIIKHYNWGMGGTDGMDQWVAMCRLTIKTVSAMPKIFLHFLQVSSANANILRNESGTQGKYQTLPEFIRKLSTELTYDAIRLKGHHNDISATVPARANNWRMKDHSNNKNRLHSTHFPWQCRVSEDENSKRNDEDNKYFRGYCMMCNRKVSIMCRNCDCYLFIDSEVGQDSCWDKFHATWNYAKNLFIPCFVVTLGPPYQAFH